MHLQYHLVLNFSAESAWIELFDYFAYLHITKYQSVSADKPSEGECIERRLQHPLLHASEKPYLAVSA